MKAPSAPKLIFSLLICQFAGLVGSLFTASAIPTWYDTLVKPGINPPAWVFGPVWITLYVLMGLALYRVWTSKENTPGRRTALTLFGAQLVLNSLWSVLFFGLQNPGLALGELTLLWILVGLTTWRFWRIEKWAGLLLVPYWVWGSFALLLNFLIWKLN